MAHKNVSMLRMAVGRPLDVIEWCWLVPGYCQTLFFNFKTNMRKNTAQQP
jgi:23S rRNA C2498 (ribose-2'-O)-methylase RlmM